MAVQLGTLDRAPPPFFRQGPSALSKLMFCSALAVFLMVADTRLKLAPALRVGIATVLHPVERALRWPVAMWHGAGDYVGGLHAALANEAAAREALAHQAGRASRVEQLQDENARLRELLGLRAGLAVKTQPAEVLYDAPDPFSRKNVIDRGAQHDVQLGAPVINEAGVLGQVTRVYPMSSEVTLLIDKDAAVPVLNVRNQLRGVAFGMTGGTGMELRFMASNADVQVGDRLQTSGVDGVYPPGLDVATVSAVDRKADTGFAKVAVVPAAASDGVRHVLVVEPVGLQLPQPPQAGASAPAVPKAPRTGARR